MEQLLCRDLDPVRRRPWEEESLEGALLSREGGQSQAQDRAGASGAAAPGSSPPAAQPEPGLQQLGPRCAPAAAPGSLALLPELGLRQTPGRSLRLLQYCEFLLLLQKRGPIEARLPGQEENAPEVLTPPPSPAPELQVLSGGPDGPAYSTHSWTTPFALSCLWV